MKLDDVKQILATSTQDDWIIDDESGSFTYKDDLNLHIERADYDSFRDFKEPWATSHADPHAAAIDYVVKYSSSFVEKQTLVSVDGHRATLPMPKSMDVLEVSASKANFARIVDIGVGNNVDEYLQRSNIQIVAD
ncbi:hypothetical protein [Shewanella baltica]|uniref:hypothetical protein n=1 Tax=Shewanella baltica TaxID=62322 RepID=UPI001B6BC4CF|nr:hypothetical protein [Shewanella baltica]MBP7662264.1 hypothetical protein [Shewanella sp.]MCS6116661.1 hypothetical protein [Shewanella baltica]UVW66437.1 hypothetical protein HHE93_23180 [Shewanella baltica]